MILILYNINAYKSRLMRQKISGISPAHYLIDKLYWLQITDKPELY
jgi:hypothetical protein